ncbi:carbohydrate ABC transporter permease [Clostridium sp.]|uniref:carbohydrate ABC transporter permease n=1 Tax=Clostridium sp. TaxID=1506 RepID=UPI003D6CF0A9
MYGNLTRLKKFIIYLVILFFSIIWIYPIAKSVIQSLQIKGLDNYASVINNPELNYFRVIFNSLFISISTATIVTITASLAAFGFSKMEFRYKSLLYYMLLACLAIPPVAVMTPLFYTVKTLKMTNSYGALILPLVAFNAPFMLMILKNYFDTIPNEIIEAASIDGCSQLSIYKIIMLPLGIPAMINVGVLTFIYSWNDFLIPLLFVREKSMYTVTIATSFYTSTKNQTPEMVAQLYAALILMSLPSILLYMFSQRYLQDGLTSGAIKG